MKRILSRPLVTVGITSHDEAESIRRCLRSVAEQSLGAEHIEVIVADDGSRDGTVRVARSFRRAVPWGRFTVLRQRNTGNASTGRNRIISAAAGRYVLFLDADDHLGPDALKAMAASAAEHSSDVVVGRYVGVNRSAPNALHAEQMPAVHRYQTGWLNTLHIQKLFRTRFLQDLSYRFNPQLFYANDHPFMINAFLRARRVSFVHDVDCYFITLEEEGDQRTPRHISRRTRPAKEQLRFLHDCFGLLALARGEGGQTASTAGRMRADYWNRLLKLHMPVLTLRKQSPAEVEELAAELANLAEIYGAETERASLAPGAAEFLAALRTRDGEHIAESARAVRASASAAPGQLPRTA